MKLKLLFGLLGLACASQISAAEILNIPVSAGAQALENSSCYLFKNYVSTYSSCKLNIPVVVPAGKSIKTMHLAWGQRSVQADQPPSVHAQLMYRPLAAGSTLAAEWLIPSSVYNHVDPVSADTMIFGGLLTSFAGNYPEATGVGTTDAMYVEVDFSNASIYGLRVTYE